MITLALLLVTAIVWVAARLLLPHSKVPAPWARAIEVVIFAPLLFWVVARIFWFGGLP